MAKGKKVRYSRRTFYILSFYLDYPTPTLHAAHTRGTWEYMRKQSAVRIEMDLII